MIMQSRSAQPQINLVHRFDVNAIAAQVKREG
jgi:hypothetical protein